MTEAMKNKLAKVNGLEQERFEDMVKEDVRKEMSVDEEFAVHRKAVAKLFDIVAKLHPDVDNTEFEEYNTLVERIKEARRNDLTN